MNAPILPEILIAAGPGQEPLLPLATDGVQRYVWNMRFGTMLIETRDGVVYVNGQRVEPFVPVVPHPE